MPIANYTTSVPVSRSVQQISDMLSKAGATSVTTLHNREHGIVGLEFGIETEYGWRPYRLPVRVQAVHAALSAEPGLKPSQRMPVQASRVAWRIAHDWLRAQLALIDAGMATLPEVMFPYTLVARDQTAFEAYAPREVTA